MSVVCRPAVATGIESLSIRVGLAVAEQLDASLPRRTGTGPTVLLKWPNDLMLPHGKLGGILAEARWQGDRLAWVVVGIGINLHNPLPQGTDLPAASLAEAGFAASPALLAQPLAARVAEVTRRVEPLGETELRAFAARDWLRGKEILLPLAGIAAGLGPGGRLRIQTADGQIAELDDSIALRLA